MHGFVRDLLNGYDTLLGGACGVESGGQKRRLAIARAQLRNKTTVVIIHDLSQITPNGFVYG